MWRRAAASGPEQPIPALHRVIQPACANALAPAKSSHELEGRGRFSRISDFQVLIGRDVGNDMLGQCFSFAQHSPITM